MLDKKAIKIDDFSGGLVTKGDELSIKNNQTTDCLNVYSDASKSLKKRNGYTVLNGTSEAATCDGIYNYRETDISQYLVSSWGGVPKKMDVVTKAYDGTWDTISENTNGTTLADAITHFTTFNGDLVITNESRGVPQKYDPDDNSGEYTDLIYGGSGTALAGKYCETWYDYLWIANSAANPDRLARSNASDHTTWTSADYNDIVTPGDVGITGLAVLRGRLYIFKKHSIHRVTYQGGTPLLEIKEVSSSTGTASPRTIQKVEVPGKGEMLIFLGTDEQLYMFDGYNVNIISEPVSTSNGISDFCMIGDESTYGINPAQLAACHAVDYPAKHWYLLFFPKADDTIAKDIFVYDYLNNTFWPFNLELAQNCSCIADNGAGQMKVYMAGVNYAHLFDSGNSDKDSAKAAEEIAAYWTSPRLDGDSEVLMKDLRLLFLTMKSVACTPTVQFRTDWDSSWSTASTITSEATNHTEDIPYLDELVQFKFADDSTDPAFELRRGTIVASGRGIAK